MADLSFVQVAADSTGKRLRTTLVTDAGATMHQEIMVLAGSTGDLWEPAVNAVATSSAVAMPVFVVTAASSINSGSYLLSTGLGTAAIDPRQATIVGGTSGAGVGTIVSTAAGSAAIDPRQATIVAATSGAGLGTILSTGAGGASIDARARTWTLSSAETVAIIGAGTSSLVGAILISTAAGQAAIDPRARTWSLTSAETVAILGTASSGVLGTVLSATGLTGAAIDPRQVTVVGGTSGAYISVLNATAQGAVTIDPRQATIVAGTSGAGIGTIVSTAAGAAAIDPRLVTLQAQTTGTTIGTVALSSVGGVRSFADSTANYNQLYYWTTGIVAAAAATMQSLNLTKNLSSGSSGTSFNVAAGKFFRIDHIEASIRVSSGTDLYADFAIRAVTSTGGATGTNFPVWYHRLSAVAESTNALAAGGGGESVALSGLSIDLPSSASYGVSITSNSTASQECTFAFGGKEITL